MYLPLTWLRFALEWAQIKNTYNDSNNRYAYDNRIQFTTYLTFSTKVSPLSCRFVDANLQGASVLSHVCHIVVTDFEKYRRTKL